MTADGPKRSRTGIHFGALAAMRAGVPIDWAREQPRGDGEGARLALRKHAEEEVKKFPSLAPLIDDAEAFWEKWRDLKRKLEVVRRAKPMAS